MGASDLTITASNVLAVAGYSAHDGIAGAAIVSTDYIIRLGIASSTSNLKVRIHNSAVQVP